MQIVESSPTASTLAAARRARLERFAEASRQFEAKKRIEQARAEQEQARAEQLAAIEVAIVRAVQVEDAPHFVVRVPARWLDGMSMAVRKCVTAMAREFGVTGKGIVSQSRIIILTVPRHCAIGIALEITGLSLPAMGRQFKRDHSTIISSRDRFRDLCQSEAFRNRIDQIIAEIKR
jgi:chromosomal replication initiation ATPase DnaA